MERILKDKLPNGHFQDVLPEHKRIMQSVRGTGNKTTEVRLRGALIRAGISGWKVNYSSVEGKPDIFFPGEKIAIFVDGCFWHGCPKCGHIPKKNTPFWKTKIERNRQRDKKVTSLLRKQGVLVIRFWEHMLAHSLSGCILKLVELIETRRTTL